MKEYINYLLSTDEATTTTNHITQDGTHHYTQSNPHPQLQPSLSLKSFFLYHVIKMWEFVETEEDRTNLIKLISYSVPTGESINTLLSKLISTFKKVHKIL